MKKQRTGVEIRTPTLRINASGEVNVGDMKHASGWDLPFAKTSIVLHIPPGRKLLVISGADRSSGDWFNQWTLMDLFFMTVILALVYRVFGILTAVIALLVMVLGYHESHMPLFLWFNLLVAVSLAKKVTGERLKKWLGGYQWVSVGLLLIALLPFLANQIRFTLYPQLEHNKSLSSGVSRTMFSEDLRRQQRPAKAPVSQKDKTRYKARKRMKALEGLRDEDKIVITGSRIQYESVESSYQPGAVIQAGKGKPQWKWKKASYRWNGPVDGDENVSVIILSRPWVILWRIALVLFSVLWLMAIFRQRQISDKPPSNDPGENPTAKESIEIEPSEDDKSNSESSNKGSATVASLWVLLCFTLINIPPLSAANFPDKALLTELQQRLYPKPECLPDCVTLGQVHLTVKGYSLVLDLSYHGGAQVAGLLPDSKDWFIESVQLNKVPVKELWKNSAGNWISLTEGISRVVIKARLKDKSELSIRFPEKPKQIVVEVEGWKVSGINQQRLMTHTLQLTKKSRCNRKQRFD